MEKSNCKYSPILSEPEHSLRSFYQETKVVTEACNPGRGFEEDCEEVIEVPIPDLSEKERKRNDIIILQLQCGLLSFVLTILAMLVVYFVYFS